MIIERYETVYEDKTWHRARVRCDDGQVFDLKSPAALDDAGWEAIVRDMQSNQTIPLEPILEVN